MLIQIRPDAGENKKNRKKERRKRKKRIKKTSKQSGWQVTTADREKEKEKDTVRPISDQVSDPVDPMPQDRGCRRIRIVQLMCCGWGAAPFSASARHDRAGETESPTGDQGVIIVPRVEAGQRARDRKAINACRGMVAPALGP
jgi:hypothetical protein